MPSGPESFVAQPAYSTEFTRAREVLLANPERWRIIYHYDGDGIASASVAVRALARLGYPVQATPLLGVERSRMEELLRATRGPVWIVDTGASWLDLVAEHRSPAVVLDHHRYPGAPHPPSLPERVAFVNPLDWGVDGMSELSASTLTWLFSIFLDPKNWDLAPWGLSGAIADRQHVGGFRGLNAKLVLEATSRGAVESRGALSLMGTTLSEAFARSIDPYIRGVSGNPEAAKAWLRTIPVEPGLDPRSLSAVDEKRLGVALTERLKSQGVRPEFVEAVKQERVRFPALGFEGEELSNLQNATGREGIPGVGVALALGDAQALERARGAEAAWRTGILRMLRKIEDEGVNQLPAVQWFESSDTPLAGTQAGFAMNYLLDSRRPVFVFSRGSRSIKVSGRGTLWLVSQGLDLATTCRTAAALVGGEGGGHPVAAGATVPLDRQDAFLQEADRLVGEQLVETLTKAAP